MRYVTITKSRFWNNALGHRPERAGLREVPAAGGQRHRRQRHLLEQLQLPRGQPPFTVARTGPRRSRRSAPACCCSAAAGTWSRATASTATTWRRRRDRRHPAREAPGGVALTATRSATTSSAWAAPTSTGATSSTTARATETASARTRCVADAARHDALAVLPVRGGENAYNQADATRCSAGSAPSALERLDQAPARGQEGLQAARGVQVSAAHHILVTSVAGAALL